MQKWFLTAVILFCTVAAWAQEEAPRWQWKRAGKGVQYCEKQTELFGRTLYVTAVRYKYSRHLTRVLSSAGRDADSTSALAEQAGAIAAINGGYFNVKTLEPVTYLKSDGRRLSSTTAREAGLRTDGVVAIGLHGHPYIAACDTSSYDVQCTGRAEALAAGPVLLQGGEPVRSEWPESGFYSRHHPRSLIGSDGKGRMYMIVIDGRFPGEGDGASIGETVRVARMFGLVDAINLDGGGSCCLWTRRTGVLNHPYDNHRFDHYGQRIVPNILYIR